MTDQLGIAVSRHDFLPFGEELATSNRTFELDYGITDNAMHRYTGQQRDLEGPGLDFFHARYFSGAQGRFTSPDPDGAGAAPGIPQLWNGYSYVGNSPQSRLDPDGLSTIILIDGVETDRPFGAFGLLGGGALAQCPNNLCSGVSDAGSYVQFTASAGAGETGYTQYQTTYVTSTMFGLTTGTVLTYPVFAPTAGTLPGFGSLVRGLAGSSGLGLLLGLAAMQNGSTPAARARSNPFIGTAGSTSTTYNPDGTPKQARRYGSDGYPETDVDYDHDHGQGKPHVHDWGRPAGGGPPTDRDRAVGRPARAADPKPN
jgi:RHS repeat-associated protein